MERVGKVIEERGENALVLMQRHSVCSKCGRCGILGNTTVKDTKIETLNFPGAKEGEFVRVSVDDSKVLTISFLLYLVPAMVLVFGIFFALQLAETLNYSGDHILFSVVIGVILAAGTIALVKIWDNSKKDDITYKPSIIGLADENSEEVQDILDAEKADNEDDENC